MGRVRRRPIPARDPDHGRPFATGELTPRVHGLLANSDPLFVASYCLGHELELLFAADPFDAVIVPMWGGAGYAAQMARATGAGPLGEVPFGVVVTDTSANRHDANGEGRWTRPAITRRQMEDVSLALADLVLTFGDRGDGIAAAGRLPGAAAPVRCPRFVPDERLERIAHAATHPVRPSRPPQLFLHEPQQAASGVLCALDAAALMARAGRRLDRPVISTGADMTFAPMKPRTFVEHWSARGWVRELVAEGRWRWADQGPRPEDVLPVRLHASPFEHLPDVWSGLAEGALGVLSPAAAEGLAPDTPLPDLVTLRGAPTAELLAEHLTRVIDTDPAQLDLARRELCALVVAAQRGERRERALRATTEALHVLLHRPPAPQDLSRAALLLLDRRRPLRDVAEGYAPPVTPAPRPGTTDGALTVVVTCYELGALVTETVESVWRADRRPDELLLVDDGSRGAATRDTLAELARAAAARALPLRVIHQRNAGLAGARNAGLDAARGEYISFLDGDDLIEPAFYGTALGVLARNRELGGVAAWAELFGEGVPDGFWNAPQPELPLLLVENTVFVPLMMRTDVLRQLGGYDERQRYNYEDWELSVRLLASGRPIVTIPRYLQRYRVRPDSLLRTMSDAQNQTMRERMFESHRETVARFAPEVAMQLEHRLAKVVHAPAPAAASAASAPAAAVPARPPRRSTPLLAAVARLTGRRP
jgi:hypothetical protein